MHVAITSDIHGNRHAFEAVLADIARSGARELWCLGDIVGYGADPNDCCTLARENAAVCLAGNHDLAVTGTLPLDEFSHGAALAARWTQEVLADEHLEWLRTLSPSGERDGVGLYHASPRDPVWEYVLSTLLAELCLDHAEHRRATVVSAGEQLEPDVLPRGRLERSARCSNTPRLAYQANKVVNQRVQWTGFAPGQADLPFGFVQSRIQQADIWDVHEVGRARH